MAPVSIVPLIVDVVLVAHVDFFDIAASWYLGWALGLPPPGTSADPTTYMSAPQTATAKYHGKDPSA